jgi:hypothetical protein
MNIAEILRALMNRTLIDGKPISENRLADETKVPQPTIHRILVGESKDPKTSTVRKLADYWELTVAQLRGEEPLPLSFNSLTTSEDTLSPLASGTPGSAPELTPKQAILLNHFEALTEEQQGKLLRELEETKQRNEAIFEALSRKKAEKGAKV